MVSVSVKTLFGVKCNACYLANRKKCIKCHGLGIVIPDKIKGCKGDVYTSKKSNYFLNIR